MFLRLTSATDYVIIGATKEEMGLHLAQTFGRTKTMTKITTIRAASENAGDTGIICVDGVNVYWDGYAVEFADCGGSWDIDPDTEIIDIGNGAYKLAKPERLVARIFEDIGGYYVCDDDLDYRDTRGMTTT